MSSEKKTESNRKNAQLSTGPNDTSQSRLNALSHGILSKRALITTGEGCEDAELFDQLADGLREDWATVGATEQLLVDQLISLTWRLTRVINYETGSIRAIADTTVEDWEREQSFDNVSYILGHSGVSWEPTDKLVQKRAELETELKDWKDQDTVSQPYIWGRVFRVVSRKFEVDIEQILELEDEWAIYEDFAIEDIRKVIDAACHADGITEDQFWQIVKDEVQRDHRETVRRLERRHLEIEQKRLLASLPDDVRLAKIQRYEAHLSREFYKALHELQRLQGARLSSIPTAPMAVDIDIQTSTPKGV